MPFEVGSFVLDDVKLELRRGNERVQLQPKSLQLLLHLVAARDRMVSSDELLLALWPNERVTCSSVRRAVRGARKALGDDGNSQRSIRTVRGHGYKLVLPVSACRIARHALVGSDGALAFLEANLHAARAGRGRTTLLMGELGVGKTRTLLEFKRRACAQGFDTWLARCVQDDHAPALRPWTQILQAAEASRGASRVLAAIGASAADAVRGVRRPPPDLPVTSFASGSARFRLSDAIAAFERAAGECPVVLLFDDLQHADRSTLRLLSCIARRLARSPVMIVGSMGSLTSQCAPANDMLASFVQDVSAVCIELNAVLTGADAEHAS